MRITFVLAAANLSGGVRVVRIHAEHLAALGHQVTVVTPPDRPNGPMRRLRAALRRRPPYQPSHPGHFAGSSVDLRVLERYRPVTDADVPDADVVIATFWKTAEWVQAMPATKGAKVYFIQGYEVHGPELEQRVRATWRLPQQKIAVAHWLAEKAAREFGDPGTIVVPNSVDLDLFDAPPRGRQSTPTVGLLYAAPAFKATEVALEACRRAAREISGLRLVSFGRCGPQRAFPLPAGAEFHQRPAQELIPRLYASCDVWLHAARSEGFGLPLLEAHACRTPAVSTRCGGPEDIIEEGVTGHFADVDDLEGLCEKLVGVLRMGETDWRSMSEAARKRAASYTWDDSAKDFERALELATRRVPPVE